MILLLLIGIGVALYLLIGLLLLSWIDYDYDLFQFIVEWPVPILELVLLFGWPVVLSGYCWRRRGWCADDASSQGSGAQNAPANSHRRSGLGVCAGSQIGTSDHQPLPSGTGRYSVEQPHQSGI
jgi:hypothetical protein